MIQFYKKNIILLLFIVFILPASVFSQNNTLYWMKNLPQSMNTNPAKQSNCKFFIDIPVIPNFSLDVANTGFTINDAIMQHPTEPDSFMINLVGIEKALSDNNNLNFDAEFSLINIGVSLRNNLYVSLGVNYKVSEHFKYPKALIEITKGNYKINGEPLSFDFGQDLMLHREFYLGVSKSFNDKLYIGGRLKFLNGYANISTNKMKIDWYTSTKEEDTYDWTFVSDVEANVSLPMEWEVVYDENDNISDIIVEDIDIDENDVVGSIKSYIPKNFGMGVDLGIEYKITDNILISASILDLGFIKWKTNSASLIQNASYTFSGLDIANYIDDATTLSGNEDDDMLTDIIDTLSTEFNPTIIYETYTTGLNPKVNIGGNIAVKEWLDFGLLYRGVFYNSNLYSSFTASANLNFFKAWSYSLSFSVIDKLANNIGMGLAYKLGPFQMYIITDNIAAPFWAVNDSETADNWIKNTKRANLSFGMNFMICKKKHDIGLLE